MAASTMRLKKEGRERNAVAEGVSARQELWGRINGQIAPLYVMCGDSEAPGSLDEAWSMS